jgi:Rieske Fe-S protein
MKINEIICERQVDEVAPLIAAIGSGLATAAKGAGAVGSAAIKGAGNVASQIGKTAVSQVGKAAVNTLTSMGSSTAPTSNDSQAKQLSQQQIQANLKGISPGTKFAYPELGQVEVLPLQAGQQGLRLRIPKVGDVTVDPKDLTNLANNLPK